MTRHQYTMAFRQLTNPDQTMRKRVAEFATLTACKDRTVWAILSGERPVTPQVARIVQLLMERDGV